MNEHDDADPEHYTLDPENARVREVFARFGRAFYESNCLERGIAGILLHVEWRANLKPPTTRTEFEDECDQFYHALESMPMGRLVARAKALRNLPEAIIARLGECLAARNKLAHHYFWERSGEFALREGQLRMMEECDAFCSLFEETDAMLTEYVRPFLERHGLTAANLESERQRIVEDAARNLSGAD